MKPLKGSKSDRAGVWLIENIENIENIYCHSLLVQYNTIQYNTMLFVYRMYTKSIFLFIFFYF